MFLSQLVLPYNSERKPVQSLRVTFKTVLSKKLDKSRGFVAASILLYLAVGQICAEKEVSKKTLTLRKKEYILIYA